MTATVRIKTSAVLIETSEAYRNPTGIGRFSRGLLAHLDGDDLLFSPPDWATRTHFAGRRTTGLRMKHFAQHVWLTQGRIARQAIYSKPRLIHSLSFFTPLVVRVPIVSTIFDLAYFDIPAQTDRFWGAYARRMMPAFAHKASAIITTSQVMKEAICRRFHMPPERVHVIYGGAASHFRPLRRVYSTERPFCLYVGAWHPHKNMDLLVKAFAQLSDVDLVITGRPYDDQQSRWPVEALRIAPNVRFPGYVDDTELVQLYNKAVAVILPSSYEGFGMPLIEAMACGTPVIASDIPVLREIGGGGAQYFCLDEPELLVALTRRLVEHPDEHKYWSRRSLQRASLFDWGTTAQQVRAVWDAVSG